MLYLTPRLYLRYCIDPHMADEWSDSEKIRKGGEITHDKS